MKLHQLELWRQTLRDKLAALERIQPLCAHCVHHAKPPHCALHQADVPPDFASSPGACSDWDHDGIPF